MQIESPFNPDLDPETVTAFAGRRDWNNNYEGPFRIDDLQPWLRMVWKDGREYMITEISIHLHNEEGKHAEVYALDRQQPQRMLIHESWINTWLQDMDSVYFDLLPLKQ